MSSNVVVLSLLLCFSSAFCNTELNYDTVYHEYVNEVIQFEAIKEKIQRSLLDIDEGTWVALQMLDASTKIPSGLLQGNVFDLGNFDECYAIKYEDIYGKYCLGTLQMTLPTQKYFDVFKFNNTQRRPKFNIHPQPRLADLSEEYIGYHFAACVPSNWSASDIPELSPGAIGTIVVLSLFLAAIVASTAFDIFLHYTNKEPPHELFISFSVLTNGRKIFKSTTNPDQLLCLNGIKAISMMWVIIGHEYSNALDAPLSNVLDVVEWQQNSANMFIMGATVSVDTFFVVGGLVTVYTFLKSMDKGVKFNIILYYIHRYLRLTPALVIMSLIHLYLLNQFANGPLWNVVDVILVETCEEGWWSTLLYITNYVQRGICVPQAWYLSVDMQLYVLSPIILIPLWRWPKIGLGALGLLAVAGCVVPFAIGYSENLGTMMTGDTTKYMNDYYIQTYTRFGPYVIGMILGYVLYKIKKSERKVRLSRLTTCILWLFFLTGLTACVYAGFPLDVAKEEDRWGNSMFLAFNRPAWAVALSGVIFLCVAGYGGPIDKFLSLPIFQFLTKLSYSMYLVHYAVITVRYSAMRNLWKFSDIAIMHAFWGDFIFTLVLSLILSLSFESPIIILEKYIFGRGTATQVQQKKKPEV
ncbi:hypothetical protein Zmor_026814 [Zophobas morio]|uniref:Nose resistant-to-fluoxetine protein N-terminal domain-containing protein n=1 Tax=Zophobas morio TaxID=2755281 RepID=A0AA38HXV3_9CUCU|nr:hypothetical protein Zmor_026814 [Zophobas morio]